MKTRLMIGFTIVLQLVILVTVGATFLITQRIEQDLSGVQLVQHVSKVQRAALRVCVSSAGLYLFIYIIAVIRERRKNTKPNHDLQLTK